jgi:hypothetical protein
MKLLANENFPGEAVRALRARGHDVLWVRREMPGAPDADVVGRARSEGRLLVTFDKDFGELAFHLRAHRTRGHYPLPHRASRSHVCRVDRGHGHRVARGLGRAVRGCGTRPRATGLSAGPTSLMCTAGRPCPAGARYP